MRGVGILDMFMVLIVLFLLIMIVIIVGLIGPSGSTVFEVDVDDSLLMFEHAQHGKPIHAILTIEQRASGVDEQNPRSIAESIDRNDGRTGPAAAIPPQIAWLSLEALPIPSLGNTETLPGGVTIDNDGELRSINPTRHARVFQIVQIDEDSRFRVSPTRTGQGPQGGVIEYALE